MSFTLDTYYEMKKDGSDIFLDLLFLSEGQSPDFTLKINGDPVQTHCKTSLTDQLLGKDIDLNGKLIKISGNIVDTSKDSNDISVRLSIKGGISTFTKDYKVTVEDDGETVDIIFIIRPYA